MLREKWESTLNAGMLKQGIKKSCGGEQAGRLRPCLKRDETRRNSREI